MFKPTFGQPSNPSGFGGFQPATNTNPFGQTSVNGFGSQPTFGSTASTGLFGSAVTSTNTGLFGSTPTTPAIGQPQTMQMSLGSENTAQPTTNLFGTQPTTGTGLFGANTSAFGQNKNTFGSNLASTSIGLFGSQQPSQTATPLFGQSNATPGGLFGSTPGGFGQQQTGTVIKFNPVADTDSVVKNNRTQNINIRYFCITCMKEYSSKTLEELRLEDYMANRKGPQTGTTVPTNTLFGASTADSGLFGQPTANKPVFGSALSFGFGANKPTTGMFGSTPTTSNSLFGTKPTEFDAAMATSTTSLSGFSFDNTPGKPLFGAQLNKSSFGATTTPQSNAFGQSTQQSTAFGAAKPTPVFSGFGNQQNQSIGSFGSNRPAFGLGTGLSSSSGFSFGTNTQTNTGNLFNKSATGAFGTATTNPVFGATNTQNNSLSGRSATGFGFGATSTANTGFGTNTFGTSNLFSNTAAKSGSLFGINTSTTGSGLFNSSFGTQANSFNTANTGFGRLDGTNFTGGSFMGNPQMPAQSTSYSPNPVFLALSYLPYSDSPLFWNLLPASGKTEAPPKLNNALFQKAILKAKDHSVSNGFDSRVKIKPLYSYINKKSLFDGLEDIDSKPAFIPLTNPKKLSLKAKSRNTTWAGSLREKENILDDGVTPRRVSFTFPVRDEDTNKEQSFYIRRNPLFKLARDTELNAAEVNNPCTPVTTNNNSPTANDSVKQLDKSSADESKDTSSDKEHSSLDETRVFLVNNSIYDKDWPPHVTGIINRRSDYYTIPSLDDLAGLVAENGSCIVDNFCIGRYDYGNIYFQGTMDVAGLNIDEIVHFRNKEVTVYPDDDNKPPVGTGLNRKCQVTLNQVWPADKSTREPIKDRTRLSRLGYEERLKRKCIQMGVYFVEYRPDDGAWVFKVDHFSKYGLSDSD